MKLGSKIALVLVTALAFGATAQADPYSDPMTNDLYNGNTPNGIPTPYNGGSGYDLFNAVNLLTGSSVQKNESLDSRRYASDDSWQVVSGQVVSFYVIGRSAKNVGSVGYYVRGNDNSIVKSTPLLTGVTGFGFNGDGLTQATGLTGGDFTPSTSTFGWYMETTDWRNGAATTYFSEPQLNPDSRDHQITYAMAELVGQELFVSGTSTKHTFTENTYLIGFEDRLLGTWGKQYINTLGDDDFNDIMILIDFSVINPGPDDVVPEPATLTLVAAGLAGIWWFGRRNRN